MRLRDGVVRRDPKADSRRPWDVDHQAAAARPGAVGQALLNIAEHRMADPLALRRQERPVLDLPRDPPPQDAERLVRRPRLEPLAEAEYPLDEQEPDLRAARQRGRRLEQQDEWERQQHPEPPV